MSNFPNSKMHEAMRAANRNAAKQMTGWREAFRVLEDRQKAPPESTHDVRSMAPKAG